MGSPSRLTLGGGGSRGMGRHALGATLKSAGVPSRALWTLEDLELCPRAMWARHGPIYTAP